MPRLSVVITARDDQAAASGEATLTSVAAQQVSDIEVLVVDDGDPHRDRDGRSRTVVPDGRTRTVVPVAGDDPRDTGAATASGDYLAFLDAGERVAPQGYAALLAALDASGSDLATSLPDGEAATATHVTRLPVLLDDQRAGNKVWRRSFWQASGLRWADGPRHDGVLVAVRSHVEASSVDVVTTPVLLTTAPDVLRARSPLSPRSEDMAAMADRLDALLAVSRLLDAAGNDGLKARWDKAVVGGDVRRALGDLTEADDATQHRLVETAGALLVGAGPEAESSMRAIHRLKFHLARRRLVPQLVDVVKAERTGELQHVKPVRRGWRHYGDYPFRADPALRVPREVYRLDKELGLRARVDDVWWEGDTLHVAGIAHISLLDVATRRSGRLRLSLSPSGAGRAITLPVQRIRRPDVTAAARESAHNYDWAGFRTSVDVRALRGKAGWSDGEWRLRATVLRSGVLRRRWVTATSPGRARHPELRELSDPEGGVRIVPVSTRGTFSVEVDTMPVVAHRVSVEGGELVVSARLREPVANAAELSVPVGGDETVTVPAVLTDSADGHHLTARVPATAVGAGTAVPALRFVGAHGPVELRAATDLAPARIVVDGDEVVARASRHGRLELVRRPVGPVLAAVAWGVEALELAVDDPCPDGAELVLRSSAAARDEVVATVPDGAGFSARVTPGAVTTLAGTLPLAQGTWEIVVRRSGPAGPVDVLAADDAVTRLLPLSRTFGAKTFTLQEIDGPLQLVSGPDLHDDERGAVNQRRLQRVEFPAFLERGLRDEVLFESYQSRVYADNARAVFEELARRDSGLTCRWVVMDGQTELPHGLEPVRRNSREHYEALARSRYVVVPNYRPLDPWLRTPQEQVVVQTWHGAPFKKIGLDNARGERASSRDYLDALRRESARWDFLLSPNPPSTPILRGAFGYDGEMLETGYPRCDVFFRPDRDELAARVRSRLGLTEDKTVVLYAPTMRDDQRYGGNRFTLDLRLDLDKARAALGDDHVLLVRRHAKVVDSVTAADGEFARDVSLWPDVNDLLLATDVLITDYSSLMFDFANTGRPMLFFTYDLEDYRDRLRGFYFDISRVPGPLLMTSDEVISGIREAAALREEYRTTYDAFVADFCAWDDGGAAARFVDQVFTRD